MSAQKGSLTAINTTNLEDKSTGAQIEGKGLAKVVDYRSSTYDSKKEVEYNIKELNEFEAILQGKPTDFQISFLNDEKLADKVAALKKLWLSDPEQFD